MSVDEVTKQERTISGALALGMHLLFLILLVVGISWQPKRSTAPVAVELWSELPPAPRKVAPPPPPPPPEPEPEPAPVKQAPRPEPRPEPRPDVKPIPKPDIALKEQLIKKKQQEEREQREREEKLAKEKEEKERLQRERKIKEELEAKRRKEKELAEQKKREEERKLAERKKREEEEKRRLAQQQREEQLKAAQEKEAAMRKLLAQQAADAEARGRLDAYSRLVADRIKRYIVEPPNLQGKPEAVFTVVQIPGGEIIDLKLKRSSGNPAYDAAAERAIRRASPLPPPPDPARFGEVRELELRIRPEDR